MDEKNSIRGRTARKVVQIAHHLPYFGHKAQNGELQRKFIAREKEWVCPAHLERRIIPMECSYDLSDLLVLSDQVVFCMELLQSKEGDIPGIILQLHGGGYYGKLHNTYRDMAAMYHEVSGGYSVLSVDYRVAPEHPYPAALEDALCAYHWILEQKYPVEKLFVVGDSAGGGLALALVMFLRDHKLPLPGGIVTMSPWTDLTGNGASYRDNFEIDPIFGKSTDSLIYKEGYYREQDPTTPYISPAYGSFEGFPPMLMQVGEYEMLLSDTLTVTEKAKAAGISVEEHIYKGMFHVFQMGLSLYPESQEAWTEVGRFIRRG